MNKVSITKNVVGAVVGLGASKIVSALARQAGRDTDSKLTQLSIGAASLILGAMAGEASSVWVEAQIVDAIETVARIKDKNANASSDASSDAS